MVKGTYILKYVKQGILCENKTTLVHPNASFDQASSQNKACFIVLFSWNYFSLSSAKLLKKTCFLREICCCH